MAGWPVASATPTFCSSLPPSMFKNCLPRASSPLAAYFPPPPYFRGFVHTFHPSIARFRCSHARLTPASTQTTLNCSEVTTELSTDNTISEEEEDGEEQQESSFLEAFIDENRSYFEDEDDVANGKSTSHPNKISLVLEAGNVAKISNVLVVLGSEAFIDQLCLASPSSIDVVHFSLLALAGIKEKHDDVRCWHLKSTELPSFSGPFEAVFLNYLPIFAGSLTNMLETIANLCKPGARIVISHTRGNRYLAARREWGADYLLGGLPNLKDLETVLCSLPLEIVNYQDEADFYLATLKVMGQSTKCKERIDFGLTSGKGSKQFPLCIRGEVVHGFGRGSKQLGFPTANLSIEELPNEAAELQKGVYYGWAQIIGESLDPTVYKMVMNVGNRPTFGDSSTVTMEVHILHNYEKDFHGKELRVVVLGFIRGEMQFNSVDELIQRIQLDIGIAKKALLQDKMQVYKVDSFFVHV